MIFLSSPYLWQQLRRHLSILYLMTWIVLVSCSNNKDTVNKVSPGNNTSTDKVATISKYNDFTLSALEKADSLISSMTLEEMVGQTLMPALPSSADTSSIIKLKKWIDDYHIGGIVLLKGNLKSAKLLSSIGREAKIPLFMAIDAEWGLGMRLEDAPRYPKNRQFNRETGEVVLFDYGQQIARESRETGINMILGPVVDVTSEKFGVIGNRSFGGDPNLVSDFGIAYAKGVEAGGVISVAKHFPGHGAALQDSHIQPARLNRTISAIDSIDLSPFRNYIKQGLSGIMAGHIQTPAIDPESKPASVSSTMLTDLLRGELEFQGLILTDAFDMGGIRGFHPADALNAGADIILCPVDIETTYEELLNDVRNGKLDFRIIKERCLRILFFKSLFSLFPQSLPESM